MTKYLPINYLIKTKTQIKKYINKLLLEIIIFNFNDNNKASCNLTKNF